MRKERWMSEAGSARQCVAQPLDWTLEGSSARLVYALTAVECGSWPMSR